MPKYWESDADLSDSSAESSKDYARDPSQADVLEWEVEEAEAEEKGKENSEAREMMDLNESNTSNDPNARAISRVMATNFQLPNLQPHQHASLFYLSLIEGRCRTQAAASINSGRSAEDFLSEDHPEVCDLAAYLFAEMSKELVRTGMISAEFAGKPLPELRLYLSSFDALLNNIAGKRQQDLSENPSQQAINSGNLITFQTDTASSSDNPPQGGKLRDLISFHQHAASSAFNTSQPKNLIQFHKGVASSPLNQKQTTSPRNSNPFQQPSSLSTSEIGNSGNFISFRQDSTTSSFEPSKTIDSRNPLSFKAGALTSSFGLQQQITSDIFIPFQEGLPSSSKALVRRGTKMSQFISPGVPGSLYKSDYRVLGILGAGGYGQVHLVQHVLDKTEYAVKSIRIRASRVQRLVEMGQLEKLLAEVKTLSRLHHQHIVLYHHCWIETSPATTESESSDDGEEDINVTGAKSSQGKRVETSQNSVTTEVASFSIGVERELDSVFRRRRRNSTTHEVTEEMIIFEADVPKKLGFFRTPDEPESDNEDNEETAHSGSTEELSLVEPTKTTIPAVDYLLYIKMRAYHLSLSDFLSPRQGPKLVIQHCFHILPTVRILLAILSGVEYIHRRGIVHRDLKPGNIFLDILDSSEPITTYGYIDIKRCKSCNEQDAAPICICPCIGDFGLIADLKAEHLKTPHSSSTLSAPESNLTPDLFSASAVGTALYMPPAQSSDNSKAIICPKLDVYSLGIIAFEMIHKFDTLTERAVVLTRLRDQATFPSAYEKHPMAHGILSMLHKSRNQRWDCAKVREWLEDLEKQFC